MLNGLSEAAALRVELEAGADAELVTIRAVSGPALTIVFCASLIAGSPLPTAASTSDDCSILS